VLEEDGYFLGYRGEAPLAGMDFARDPVQISISPVSMLKCSSVPRPVAPSTPDA